MARRGILIGIAGGSASGKTSVAERIFQGIDSDHAVIIRQDSYYKSITVVRGPDGIANFDHPDALDLDLLQQHVEELLAGRPVRQPVYDFSLHERTGERLISVPQHVVVLEGTLVLYVPALRARMDIKIFIDTDADVRLLRRLQRDVAERGRTVESVIEQYEQTVRPMHAQFVEPTKRYADIIVPEGGHNLVAIDVIQTKIRTLLEARLADDAGDATRPAPDRRSMSAAAYVP
jgi:uridine kinase